MDSFKHRNYYVVIDKKSKNKNTYIRMKTDGSLLITTPYHTNKEQLLPFIDQYIDRIENKYDLEKMKKSGYQNNDIINYLDNQYTIQVKKTNGNQIAFIEKEYLYIMVKDINDKEVINKLVDKFMVESAKKILEKRFFEIVQSFQHIDFLPKLKVRKMISKYGTCYYKRNEVVLSSMLLHYDQECIDYVIVHELAHFIIPNHSKKFYNLVSIYLPNYKNAENKLKNLKR
ncbi:M48 family metallopeptidase [Mycoplasma sp. P36-A1]|uniref:M48 family metallopeptidase n=1 Tax=Mycoplasma sp. P36-A1 TaxID=3252900 RepID=UPI003C2BF385